MPSSASEPDEGWRRSEAALNLDWDWEGAEREYKRTLELDPAAGQHGYALLLAEDGRFPEAIEQIQRAEELDAMTLPLRFNAGSIYMNARRYGRAEQQFRMALETFPEAAARAHTCIGWTLVSQGRRRGSRRSGRRSPARALLPQVEAMIRE